MLAQHGIRDEVNKVVRLYFDAKEDYRLASKRGPDEAVRAELLGYCDRRGDFHMDIQEIETQLGVEMSDNGNVLPDFRRDWERLRGPILGHGFEAALRMAHDSDSKSIRQLEYLISLKLPEPLAGKLQAHAAEIRESISRVEALLSPSTQKAM